MNRIDEILQKLTHPIQSIRLRSLQNLNSKLQHNLVDVKHEISVRTYFFFVRIFFFNFVFKTLSNTMTVNIYYSQSFIRSLNRARCTQFVSRKRSSDITYFFRSFLNFVFTTLSNTMTVNIYYSQSFIRSYSYAIKMHTLT